MVIREEYLRKFFRGSMLCQPSLETKFRINTKKAKSQMNNIFSFFSSLEEGHIAAPSQERTGCVTHATGEVQPSARVASWQNTWKCQFPHQLSSFNMYSRFSSILSNNARHCSYPQGTHEPRGFHKSNAINKYKKIWAWLNIRAEQWELWL